VDDIRVISFPFALVVLDVDIIPMALVRFGDHVLYKLPNMVVLL
jgi:hypothetical protein